MANQPEIIATPLPSQTSASALVKGDLTALPTVILHLVGRAAIIGTAMAVFGERDPKRYVGGALAGALGIEVFVVLHELFQQRTTKPPVNSTAQPVDRYYVPRSS